MIFSAHRLYVFIHSAADVLAQSSRSNISSFVVLYGQYANLAERAWLSITNLFHQFILILMVRL